MMGNQEEGKKPSKPENSSSPVPDHAYPDWAAMQAYYGPGVALPPPYYSSAIASGHTPPQYVWGPPQHMMQPYGPYAAFYPQGAIYAHPAVPLGSHANGHSIPSSPTASESVVPRFPAVIPLSIENPQKSSVDADQGLVKKLKGFDGLAMSIGNGNTDSAEGGSDHGLSLSGETEGSTDASSAGNIAAAGQDGKKRGHEGTHTPTEGKMEGQGSPVPAGEQTSSADKIMGFTFAPVSVTGKVGGMVHSPSIGNLEVKKSLTVNMETSALFQNERDLKRERRKQSNRESARRSRLRRQAEAEELAKKVETLGAENISLKSEIACLTENSEKLRVENAALMEKLANAHVVKAEEMFLDKVGNNMEEAASTENLLARVSNSGSVVQNLDDEDAVFEKKSNSSSKLHQLLGAAVAAG